MIWSWSHFDTFGQCPRRYHEQFVLKKFWEAKGEKQLWGDRVHKAMEIAVRDGTELEESLQGLGLESKIALLRSVPGEQFTEQKLAIDKKLQPCNYWDNAVVWCRGVVDYSAVNKSKAIALDYKTGKRKLTNQLKLMALLLFAHFKEVSVVETGFMWLATKGKIDNETYRREDLLRLWKEFMPRLLEMKQSFELDLWPAKPSGLCRGWCSVVSCPYNLNYKPETRE